MTDQAMSLLRLFAASLLLVAPAAAQKDPAPPQPVPYPPPIVAPVDRPYAGPIELAVDLSNVTDRVAHVREHIPVERGAKELVLLYPQWLPGNHAPSGPVMRLAGIVTKVDGRTVQWTRDPVNMFAFHVPLSAGVQAVDLAFDYLSPMRDGEGRIEMSDAIADLEWNEVTMYPAGYFSRQILFDVTLTLPDGWKHATALEPAGSEGATLKFQRTTLATLIDSPLYAGPHYKRVDISPSAENQVFLDLFGDEEKDVQITPDELQKHKQLASEAEKLYGSHHYKHYDFLFLLSDTVGGIGLEHHQSSEDGARANYLTDWSAGVLGRDLLAHEYTHSWCGKFRRPADLWTPNFNLPMRDSLLWVYEGMTEYWGIVLTARSGLRSADETRDVLARIAANYEDSPGRDWRPLIDTTNQPIISHRGPQTWTSWQRTADYYQESALIWLDADTRIRELTNGQRSLDDFSRAFFGIYDGSFVTVTYTFEDVVKALNGVAPYDWAGFLRERVYMLHPAVPEDGFTRGGYKLAYTDTLPAWAKKAEGTYGSADFSTSLGFTVAVPRTGGEHGGPSRPMGSIGSVWWQSPAFKAGVTPDMQLISVNGKAFSADMLREAILAAEQSRQPLQLQFKRGDKFTVVSLAYSGGLRIPSLQRVEATPARLDDILAPSKAAGIAK